MRSDDPARPTIRWALAGLLTVWLGVVVLGIGLARLDRSESREFLAPPQTYDVEIPGCSAVAPPEKLEFHWSNAAPDAMLAPDRIRDLERALRAALPADTVVDVDDFGPVFSGSVDTWAFVHRGALHGELYVSITRDDGPIPFCTAGRVDRREIHADGTVVDSVRSAAGVAGLGATNEVIAYRSDGTTVHVRASDRLFGEEPSRAVPLSIGELVTIALDPGLTAPVS